MELRKIATNTSETKSSLKVNVFPFLLIAGVALLLVLPNVIHQGMILGSDSIFHFNRFYDTAMQLKSGNFQYFINLYGFQQSGRIVNAFYGPLMAYFQGLLVLIGGSWFGYQVLSNFVLYFISAASMFILLRKSRLQPSVSLPVAILYMSTFAIQYWISRQGFTSWGAAILPLCLLPIIDMVRNKTIKPVQLALLVSLMIETHLFSCLLLVLIYIPFFIYCFFMSRKKADLIRKLLLAIGLCLLVTAHFWAGMLELYGSNEILAPFINQNMASSTITQNSIDWVLNPIFLSLIFVFQTGIFLRFRQRLSTLNKLSFSVSLIFLLLSTSLIPWNTFVQNDVKIVELIQFPFRFFVPFTVLLLLSFALSLQEVTFKLPRWKKLLKVGTVLALMQVLIFTSYTLNSWETKETNARSGKHTLVHLEEDQLLKQSFFDSDLSKSLAYLEKATPDYLPIQEETTENKYELYKKEILLADKNFIKRVEGGQLIIEWDAAAEADISLPVVVYSRTKLRHNDIELTENELQLSSIGSLTGTQKAGKNTLVVSYAAGKPFLLSLLISLTSCAFLLLLTISRKLRSANAGLVKVFAFRRWLKG